MGKEQLEQGRNRVHPVAVSMAWGSVTRCGRSVGTRPAPSGCGGLSFDKSPG